MSRVVFVDTSAWLPVFVRRDPLHAWADRTLTELVSNGAQLVTSNLVIAELHVLILRRIGIAEALKWLESVRADQSYDVRFADRNLHGAAIDRWLRPFRDQGFSLADAVSFEIMRQEGIRTAFALDRHFAAAGFELLLG